MAHITTQRDQNTARVVQELLQEMDPKGTDKLGHRLRRRIGSSTLLTNCSSLLFTSIAALSATCARKPLLGSTDSAVFRATE